MQFNSLSNAILQVELVLHWNYVSIQIKRILLLVGQILNGITLSNINNIFE